jgi:hypothetical protein
MLEEEKKTQIEKSNLLLFNKMRNIMGRADPRNKPNGSQTRKQGRYSMEFTRIQEENRSISCIMQQCISVLKDSARL